MFSSVKLFSKNLAIRLKLIKFKIIVFEIKELVEFKIKLFEIKELFMFMTKVSEIMEKVKFKKFSGLVVKFLEVRCIFHFLEFKLLVS